MPNRKNSRPPPPPSVRPAAPHIQAAIQGVSQAKPREPSPQPDHQRGGRAEAPHVQLVNRALQGKLSPDFLLGRSPAAHVLAAVQGSPKTSSKQNPKTLLRAEGMIQRAEDPTQPIQDATGAAEEISFADWANLHFGDHPPNEMSVVDAHLPTVGTLVRHDASKIEYGGWRANFDNPEFGFFIYTVRSGAGSHMVFVVWPAAYKKNPPRPNRLGWLPQMEFGALAGQTDPKKISSGVTITFTYKDMNEQAIELNFTKK